MNYCKTCGSRIGKADPNGWGQFQQTYAAWACIYCAKAVCNQPKHQSVCYAVHVAKKHPEKLSESPCTKPEDA
jgi:hypothetical protein